MRNALAHVPKGQHTVVAAAIRQAFTQPDRDSAGQTWRHVADQVRGRWPKLAVLMDESEADVLAYISFPSQHRAKLHSTNPLERLNKEVKRRADVVGIFPNEEAIIRLIGAVLFEQNDEWLGQHRYMQVEAFPQIDATERDPLLSITTQAARAMPSVGHPGLHRDPAIESPPRSRTLTGSHRRPPHRSGARRGSRFRR
jgi:hypothetical protein